MNRQFWARVAFACLAVVIIGLTATYTQLYSQSVQLLSQLQSIDTQQMSDRAERFYRVYTKHGDSSSGTGLSPGDARFEAYIHTYEDLLDTDGKLGAYMPFSETVIQQESKVPVLSDLYNAIRTMGAHPDDQSYLGALAAKAQSAGYAQLDAAPAPAAGPATTAAAPASTDSLDEDDSLSLSDARKLAKESFLEGAGLHVVDSVITGAGGSLQSDIWRLQSNAQLYGTLILPALYGMVGAIVFFMRRILEPARTRTSASILVVRVALGGLAGVSGGYLLESLHAGETSVHEPGASLFILAFVFGFSSDLFFRVIDRAVSTISDSIAPDKPKAAQG